MQNENNTSSSAASKSVIFSTIVCKVPFLVLMSSRQRPCSIVHRISCPGDSQPMSEVIEVQDNGADEFLSNVGNSIDMAFRKVVTFPGDNVTSNVTGLTKEIRIGNGLVHVDDKVMVTTAGTLHYRSPSYYWTESTGKRYAPHVGDQVVGVIEDKGGDFYIVNTFSGASCIMNRLAFDGATKRNKPELKRGDVIYARVISANPDSEAELSCMAVTGPKKEWSTGETIYGELSQGLMIRVSLGLARKMLQPECLLLNTLNSHFSFEVAIGINGAVWLRAANNSTVDAIVIRNAILQAEELDDAQLVALVEELVKRAKHVGRPAN